MSERGTERLGQTIRGKYRVDALIGEGGMAVVYAVTHRNAKRFAVKMLHPELSRHEDTRQRFIREGYVANTVNHPGAVAVVDDDVAEDGAAFLVMELLEGDSVEGVREKLGGRLPPKAALIIVDQLLDVLASAHARGIVHRDLKPANLFLTNRGEVKVLDFGIARVRELGSGPASATQTGALMGTPAFLPPEQAGGRTSLIDPRTDLWAAGATLFTLLTSEFVHVAENPAQMVILAATTPSRSVGSVMSLPPNIVALVDRALAFDRDARFPNAAAMREALQRAYAESFGAMSVSDLRGIVAAPDTDRSALAASVALPSPFGGTTAKPVMVSAASMPSFNATSSVPVSKTPFVVLGGVAALALAGLVGGGIYVASHRETATQQTASVASSPPPAPSATETTQPIASVTASVTSAAPSISVAPTTPTAPATVTRTRPAPSATAQAPHAPTGNCPLVTIYDSTGRHFKEVCN